MNEKIHNSQGKTPFRWQDQIEDQERLSSRQNMKERVNCDTIGNATEIRKCLEHFTSVDSGSFKKDFYYASVTMGIGEHEKQMKAPGWEHFGTQLCRHNLVKLADVFENQNDRFSENIKPHIQNFQTHLRQLTQTDTWKQDDFDSLMQDSHFEQMLWLPVIRQPRSKNLVHCTNFVGSKGFCRANAKDVDARLYLSPKIQNLVPLMYDLVNEYDKNDMKYYFKFSNNGYRNDRLVIYTDYQNIQNNLDVLSAVQQNNPALFEGMGKNPFWGNIKDAPEGVYFGEEPRSHESYGSVRGAIFDRAYEILKNDNGVVTPEQEQNLINNDSAYPQLAKQFNNLVIDQAQQFGVGGGSKGFCFNSDKE